MYWPKIHQFGSIVKSNNFCFFHFAPFPIMWNRDHLWEWNINQVTTIVMNIKQPSDYVSELCCYLSSEILESFLICNVNEIIPFGTILWVVCTHQTTPWGERPFSPVLGIRPQSQPTNPSPLFQQDTNIYFGKIIVNFHGAVQFIKKVDVLKLVKNSFYRTQKYQGPDLWVQVSLLCLWQCFQNCPIQQETKHIGSQLLLVTKSKTRLLHLCQFIRSLAPNSPNVHLWQCLWCFWPKEESHLLRKAHF